VPIYTLIMYLSISHAISFNPYTFSLFMRNRAFAREV
jgi:hypothetical protein